MNEAVTLDRAAGQRVAADPIGTLSLTLTINGEARKLQVEPWTTLLDLLRHQLDLTGSKKGCDHGQCGACTVLVDGRRTNACLVLAVTLDGREVTTVEGLADGDDLHPVQQAFLDHDAFQCGYCTPGQICSAVGALDELEQGWPSHVTDDLTGDVAASAEEVRERMSGNICRCGAYAHIVTAVQEVAR